MEKVVTYVGNSVGLILDRVICEVMGIEAGSIVKIAFEGNRLVLERTGKMKKDGQRRRLSREVSSAPRIRRPETVADPKESIVSPDFDENGEYFISELVRDHEEVVLVLIQKFGLDTIDICRLDPRTPSDARPRTNPAYRKATVRLLKLLSKQQGAEDIVVARRVRFVYDNMGPDAKRDELVLSAIESYPWPTTSNDDMSAGSGAEDVTMPPSG